MKRFVIGLIAVAALVLAGSTPVEAQIPYRTMSQLNGDLSTACAAGNITYQLVIVTDAASSTDCSTGSGDGTTPSVCWCIDGAFAALSAATSADLSAYAPLAGADFTGPVTAPNMSFGDGSAYVLSINEDGLLVQSDALEDLSLDLDASDGSISARLRDPDSSLGWSLGLDGSARAADFGDLGSGPSAAGYISFYSATSPFVVSPTGCVDLGVPGDQMTICGASSDPPYTCDGSAKYGLYTDTDDGKLYHCNKSSWAATY